MAFLYYQSWNFCRYNNRKTNIVKMFQFFYYKMLLFNLKLLK